MNLPNREPLPQRGRRHTHSEVVTGCFITLAHFMIRRPQLSGSLGRTREILGAGLETGRGSGVWRATANVHRNPDTAGVFGVSHLPLPEVSRNKMTALLVTGRNQDRRIRREPARLFHELSERDACSSVSVTTR